MPAKEILYCLKKGKKIQAVKIAKESIGLSLSEAKEYVDNIELKMKMGGTLPKQRQCSVGISAIDGMEGHEFEYFCADLLRKVGFSEVTVTPGSGDQGVDILAKKDGIKYAIQCKNYAIALGNTPVQEVSAGKLFYNCHVGVVMTNSTFTHGAYQLASATNVLLWDRNKLQELISMAGGLGNLGIYQECDDFSTGDEIEDGFDDDFDDEDSIQRSKSVRSGKGLAIWSKICLGWSVLCFLFFIVGVLARVQEVMTVGLAEGVFVLVVGLMLGALAKAEKGIPYICLCGKNIKKSLFVICCIIIAYVFFFIAMKITGWDLM